MTARKTRKEAIVEQQLPELALGLDPLFWQDVKLFCSHLPKLSPHATLPGVYLLYQRHPIRFVCLVGIITAIRPSSQQIVYTVEDGTGAVSCKAWDNSFQDKTGYNEENRRPILGDLVCVRGQVNDYLKERHINISSIDIIRDPNMETLHWLEVLTLERDVYSEASKIPQEVLENQVVIPWYMQPCAEGTISVDQESPSDIADERNDDDFSEENSTHSSSWKSKRRLDRKQQLLSYAHKKPNEAAFRAVVEMKIEEYILEKDTEERISYQALLDDASLMELARITALAKARQTDGNVDWDKETQQKKATDLLKNTIEWLIHCGHIYPSDRHHDMYVLIRPQGNLAKAVYKILCDAMQHTTQNSSGVRIRYIEDMLKQRYTQFEKVHQSDINASLKYLIDEGTVYEAGSKLYKAIL